MSANSTTDIERMRRQTAARIPIFFDGVLKDLADQDNQIACLRRALEMKGKGIQDNLKGLQKYLKQIEDNAGNQVDGPLPEDISGPIKWAQNTLDEVREQVTQARDISSKLAALGIDNKRLDQRRDRLFKHASSPSKTKALRELNETWNEGLDFISGLCIRRAGLDRGLCQIADHIIAEVRWSGVEAMAVPGRGGKGFIAQIIHLHLPEWSIWAIPLTAHELWHMGIHDGLQHGNNLSSNEVLSAILEQAESEGDIALELEQEAPLYWHDPVFQLCLADVFGTFALGPGYAYACIGLVLDPESPIAQQRALSIFKTLRTVSEFSAVAEELHRQWEMMSRCKDELKYGKWINAQLKYLQNTALEFRVERWRELRNPLVDALKSGRIEELSKSNIQLRYLLTAAWKARIEFPDLADGIMRSTTDLCRELMAANATQVSRNHGLANM